MSNVPPVVIACACTSLIVYSEISEVLPLSLNILVISSSLLESDLSIMHP